MNQEEILNLFKLTHYEPVGAVVRIHYQATTAASWSDKHIDIPLSDWLMVYHSQNAELLPTQQTTEEKD